MAQIHLLISGFAWTRYDPGNKQNWDVAWKKGIEEICCKRPCEVICNRDRQSQAHRRALPQIYDDLFRSQQHYRKPSRRFRLASNQIPIHRDYL